MKTYAIIYIGFYLLTAAYRLGEGKDSVLNVNDMPYAYPIGLAMLMPFFGRIFGWW